MADKYWMFTLRKEYRGKVMVRTFTSDRHPLEWLDINEQAEDEVDFAIVFAMPIDEATYKKHGRKAT